MLAGPTARAARWSRRAPEVGVLIAFAAFAAVALAHHDLWFDELQAWGIAAPARSLGDVMHRLRWEGHPPLWYVVLFAASRFSRAPETMKVVTWAVAVTGAALVLLAAPFPRWLRVALVFGYFPSFEYLALSRSYVLDLALTVALCSAGWARHRRWWLVGALAALLCVTSAYGVLVAAAVTTALAGDELRSRRRRPGRVVDVDLAAGVALAGAGVVISAAFRPPPGFAVLRPTWAAVTAFRETLGAFWRALVPFPGGRLHWWNTDALDEALGPRVTAVAGFAVFAVVAWAFRRRPAALWCWVVGGAAVAACAAWWGQLAMRHQGHVFLVFLAAAWAAAAWHERPGVAASGAGGPSGAVASSGADAPSRAGGRASPFFARRAESAVVAAVAVIGVVTGVVVTFRSWERPFDSLAPAVAFIRHQPAGIVVGADPDTMATSLTILTGRDVVSPRTGRHGPYVVWDAGRRCLHPGDAACATDGELVARLRAMAGPSRPAWLLLNRPLAAPLDGTVLVSKVVGGELDGDDVWIYAVAP